MLRGMKIAVMGAGAVGCTFGARLAEAGHEVTFVARGRHLEALQTRGLELHSTLGDVRLEPTRAVADPAEVGEVDLVLFTVKSQDTAEALLRAAPLVGDDSRVLTLQNGVRNVEALVGAFGPERVYAGVSYLEAVVAAAGVVVHKSPFARIVYGALAADDARLDEVDAALRGAGIEVELVDDPRAAVWRKWLFICGFSGVTALTRRPIGPVLACEETLALFEGALREVAALAPHEGVTLPGDVVEQTVAFARERVEPSMTSSLAQDLAAGKPLELEALNGEVVRLGRVHGVPTPVNAMIHAALVLHAGGDRSGPPA